MGTARRAVAVRAAGGDLVGPDNGLLIAAAERLGGVEAAVTLPVPAAVPATFHGRDVFAPAAAELARGTELTALGAPLDPATLVRLPALHARLRSDGALEAEVLLVDTFGNVQLAAEGALLADAGLRPPGRALVWAAAPGTGPSLGAAGGTPVTELAVGVTFGSVAPGELVLYVDAAGMAAIAVRDGDAARTLAVAPADRLALCRAGTGV